MHPVESTISQLNVGDPVVHGALAVFPLLSTDAGTLPYLLLADALKKDLVTVREVSKGGSVPDLAVDNRADLPVLVLDGEELVGAKQNRVVNLSMMIPASDTTIIPVSCVERGRWSRSHRRPHFADSDRVHYAEGRAMNRAHVHANLRRTGGRHSAQGEVWRNIDEKAARMEAPSPTAASSAIFERHAAAMNEFVQKIVAVPGQVGAVFAIGQRRLGLDLFDKPDTFAAVLPKLVRSYGIDALEYGDIGGGEEQPSLGRAVAQSLLDQLRNAALEEHPAVGLGQDVLIRADRLVAGALVVKDAVVHLTAFSESLPARTDAGDARTNSGDSRTDAGDSRSDRDAATPRMAGYRQRHASLHSRIR